jgi:transposase
VQVKLDFDKRCTLRCRQCAAKLPRNKIGEAYYKREGWATRALNAWCDLADASGLAPFQRLARGFRRQCSRITSYIKYKVTSGRIEGFNSQISRIIQRACGIANLDYLFLRLRHQSVMQI